MRLFSKSTLSVLALVALLPLGVSAQDVPTQTQVRDNATVPNRLANQQHELQSFVAQYDVVRGGMNLGRATLQVQPTQGNRWRADLLMRATGFLSIAGIHADTSTVFDVVGNRFRPISQATTRRSGLFGSKQAIGIFNWGAQTASWTGDVKDARRRPVTLQEGDLTGLLINLAVVRDAKPGQTLNYRFVDEGRVRNHTYQVASTPENITVDGMEYETYRVTRTDSQKSNDETVLWVVPGGDTPIRMQQLEDGKETFNLQLIEYRKGASA